MKILLIIFTSIFFSTVNAQLKVANYSIGEYGTKAYEHLAFWTENGKRTYIEYSYGIEPTEVKLTVLEQKNVTIKKSIKVQFPNGYTLYVNPNGLNLNINDDNGKYSKTFEWEYEGPIEGRGTFCEICAEDEKEAMRLVQKSYLQ
ncbi:MAG: hypothetical protein V4548_06360 [Bacteroidota bacterium]